MEKEEEGGKKTQQNQQARSRFIFSFSVRSCSHTGSSGNCARLPLFARISGCADLGGKCRHTGPKISCSRHFKRSVPPLGSPASFGDRPPPLLFFPQASKRSRHTSSVGVWIDTPSPSLSFGCDPHFFITPMRTHFITKAHIRLYLLNPLPKPSFSLHKVQNSVVPPLPLFLFFLCKTLPSPMIAWFAINDPITRITLITTSEQTEDRWSQYITSRA